jgi:hypothetical protein
MKRPLLFVGLAVVLLVQTSSTPSPYEVSFDGSRIRILGRQAGPLKVCVEPDQALATDSPVAPMVEWHEVPCAPENFEPGDWSLDFMIVNKPPETCVVGELWRDFEGQAYVCVSDRSRDGSPLRWVPEP